MFLHTSHPPDFDICSNFLDYSKSPHYSVCDDLKRCYDWLFGLLGTNQVIWCYPMTHVSDPVHGREGRQWRLNVPDDKIIKEINSEVWDYAIMNMSLIPDVVYDRWQKEWETICGNKDPTFDDETLFFDAKEQLWIDKFGSREEQWKSHIFTNTSRYEHEYLIPFPVQKEWVIDVLHYSEYDVNFHENMYNVGFSNKEDAENHIEIIHSFMKNRNLEYTVNLKQYENGNCSVMIDRLWEKNNGK